MWLLVLICRVDKEVLETEQKVFPASSDGKQAVIEVYQVNTVVPGLRRDCSGRALVETAAPCVTFSATEKSSAAANATQPMDKPALPAEPRA